MQRHRRDLAAQFGPAQFLVVAALVSRYQRWQAGRVRRVHMAQHLVGVIGLRPHKPLCPGHYVVLQHRAVRRRRAQVKVVPDALPKRVQVGHGPVPQRLVVSKAQAAFGLKPVLVQPDLRHIGGRGGRGGGVGGHDGRGGCLGGKGHACEPNSAHRSAAVWKSLHRNGVQNGDFVAW